MKGMGDWVSIGDSGHRPGYFNKKSPFTSLATGYIFSVRAFCSVMISAFVDQVFAASFMLFITFWIAMESLLIYICDASSLARITLLGPGNSDDFLSDFLR